MRTWIVLLCLALTACASTPPAPPRPDHLLRDDLFGAPSMRIDAADLFALSAPMRDFLTHEIAPRIRTRGAPGALAEALQKKSRLQFDYDAAMTRNAAEAFDARAANCLSLVLLAAAFARELEVPVRYQSAYLEETWSRSGDLLVKSGHINIALGARLMEAGSRRWVDPLTIDFLPAAEIRGMRIVEIGESTVVAMYMNNRAIEVLAQGRLDDAYAWVRAAITQDPRFLISFNTLGVIYARRGEPAAAAPAFEHVLARDPDDKQAMANLAETLARLGRTAEAAEWRRRLAQVEPHPPLHFFNLGLAAMQRADFRAARDLFAREATRADDNPQLHYWLALANFRLGDLDAARRQLAQARDNSTSRGDRELYAAKLAWLRSVGAH